MKDWKGLLSLVKFELTASPLYLLRIYFLGPIFLLFAVLVTLQPFLATYLQSPGLGFDLLFLLIFLLLPVWLMPKTFHAKSLDNGQGFWAVESFIMQLQWPIALDHLIKSRLIIHSLTVLPLQAVLLCFIYLTSPELQGVLSPGSYIVFSVTWLAAGIYLGYVIPAGDIGDFVTWKSFALSFIALFGGGLLLLALFQQYMGYGLVYGTILLSQNYPIPTVIVSIMLALLGYQAWIKYMKTRVETIDYF